MTNNQAGTSNSIESAISTVAMIVIKVQSHRRKMKMILKRTARKLNVYSKVQLKILSNILKKLINMSKGPTLPLTNKAE
ncbi:hypothetical protein [Paenibacillus elgii]|uniref:hypothetical protein n=1 Tax=Paenibacillus elgii TaxID=189691 RepID=UPI00049226EE|nr:hypothetical protein [Paenibacillus elgii]